MFITTLLHIYDMIWYDHELYSAHVCTRTCM